jgi:DNA-binding NarL/FixJ family response regulator
MDGPPGVPAEEGTITVFLLDDHELVRRGVRTLLDSEPGIEVIGESGSAAEGEVRIAALRPRVAIVDGRLPDGSGIEVCRQVRSVDRRIEVLVLTSYDDDDALFAAIMAGASGYVLKQISSGDLVTAVRRVAAGQSMLDPAVTARVLHRLRQGSDRDPLTQHLTPKEEQVLGLVAEGMPNRAVAQRLYVSVRTVEKHVERLLAKTGSVNRTQLAALAIRRNQEPPGRDALRGREHS